jgi:hypothetical protein
MKAGKTRKHTHVENSPSHLGLTRDLDIRAVHKNCRRHKCCFAHYCLS